MILGFPPPVASRTMSASKVTLMKEYRHEVGNPASD